MECNYLSRPWIPGSDQRQISRTEIRNCILQLTVRWECLCIPKSAYNERYDLSLQGWARSHFLEDLSQCEIECAMIDQPKWNWAKSKAHAHQMKGLHVSGVSGSAVNFGNTRSAMADIMANLIPKICKVSKYLP